MTPLALKWVRTWSLLYQWFLSVALCFYISGGSCVHLCHRDKMNFFINENETIMK